MTAPQEAPASDANDVERHPCPRCRAEPGSPCRSRSGAVAGTYHTGRFTKVPRLAKLLRVPAPADRGPGQPWRPGTPVPLALAPDTPNRRHPHRVRPVLDPHPGTPVAARRARQARHPPPPPSPHPAARRPAHSRRSRSPPATPDPASPEHGDHHSGTMIVLSANRCTDVPQARRRSRGRHRDDEEVIAETASSNRAGQTVHALVAPQARRAPAAQHRPPCPDRT
ncbi:zinc finger domain-containing protein [Streptomyces syringium]|uniref:zinc finger domain-containing protein n=1 Tax=Streptomyces syringium TaxID=76729 RepID=UPI003D90C813